MAGTTLNIRVAPRRMLTLTEAADYCGVTAKRFPIDCGIAPVEFPSGVKVYDMRDLDSYLDGLKGGAEASDEAVIGKLGKRA
jgi:hypothetical protein